MFENTSAERHPSFKHFWSLTKAFLILLLGVSIFLAFFYGAACITVLLSPFFGAGLFGVCGYYGPIEFVWLDLFILLSGTILGIITAFKVVRKVGTRII